MEKNTTWMVQKPQGSPPMITTWSTSGTPAWHRLFLRSHKKKTTWSCWLLRDLWFGVFVSGRGFGKLRKMMKEKIHTVFTQPKEQPWLHCLQSPVFGFYVLCFWGPVIPNLSFGDFGCLETCTRSNNTYPPKHTVPPRNKALIRPTIMGNTHSPISP